MSVKLVKLKHTITIFILATVLFFKLSFFIDLCYSEIGIKNAMFLSFCYIVFYLSLVRFVTGLIMNKIIFCLNDDNRSKIYSMIYKKKMHVSSVYMLYIIPAFIFIIFSSFDKSVSVEQISILIFSACSAFILSKFLFEARVVYINGEYIFTNEKFETVISFMKTSDKVMVQTATKNVEIGFGKVKYDSDLVCNEFASNGLPRMSE